MLRRKKNRMCRRKWIMVAAIVLLATASRVPWDLCTLCSGMHEVAYRNLRKYLQLPREEIRYQDELIGLAAISPDLLEKLEVDTRGIWLGDLRGGEIGEWSEHGYHYMRDAFGVIWRMPMDGGLYHDPWKHPLPGGDPESIDRHIWPKANDAARWAGLKENALTLKAQGYPVVLGSVGIVDGYMLNSMWLQGYEECLANMAAKPAFTERLLDKLLELNLVFWEAFLTDMADYVDVVFCSDDLAGQQGPLVAPEMIDRYFRPRYRRVHDLIHQKAPHVKILFHSCGAVAPFVIKMLIDVGVDAINPVQVSADGMDTMLLKKEYGRDISFWGGGIDTQFVLPKGTEAEIRGEVRRRLNDLMPGGALSFRLCITSNRMYHHRT